MKDEAVSSVVAAVLVFSLFSTGFLLWTLNTMPEWIADKEHEHLHGVRNDFATFQATLEGLSSSGQSGPISSTIDLAANPIPLVQQTGNRGELGLVDGFGLTASILDPALYAIDGQGVGQPDETADTTYANIADLRMLELQLGSGPGDWMSVTIADNTTAANVGLVFRHQNSGDKCTTITVTHGSITRTTLLTCGLNGGGANQLINALSPEYGLSAMVGQLENNLSVSFVTGDGAYAASWIDTGGRPGVAGTGLTGTGWSMPPVNGKSMVFGSNVQRFADQDVYWDGGAVIAKQASLSSVVRPPTFLIETDDNNENGYLRWTILELDGDGSLSGAGQSTVLLTHTATQAALFTTDTATFTLTSEVSAAWGQLFEDEKNLGGLDDDCVDVTIPAAGSPAILALDATGACTLDTWIIELRIIHATVEIN